MVMIFYIVLVGKLVLVVVVMFGFGFVFVLLYDVFCDIIGINGKINEIVVMVYVGEVDEFCIIMVEFIICIYIGMLWEFWV